MAGRPKKPTNVLNATGAFKKNPNRKRGPEPQSKNPLGPAPDDFDDDQRAAYEQIKREAPPGVLTEADSAAVEMAARTMDDIRKGNITAAQLGRLQSFLVQFGMTPSGRANLNMPTEPKKNGFADL